MVGLDFDLKKRKRAIEARINQTYKGDLGAGDTTSIAVLKQMKIRAVIIANEPGILAGTYEALMLLKRLGIGAKAPILEGKAIKRGEVLLEMNGSAHSILSAERTVLNFMSRLSGIATATRAMAKKTGGARIAATRKTLLHLSDKRAVKIGGGATHRLSLEDMILIKDNHIDIVCRELGCGKLRAIEECMRRANSAKGDRMVEIEVKTLAEAKAALAHSPDIMMADGVSPTDAKKIAQLAHLRGVLVEISGNITASNISRYSRAGADYVSSGTLTHSCKALDMSLEVL
jgi:nicotinate-nucleotide pyrophosphorylase (carboxylating)